MLPPAPQEKILTKQDIEEGLVALSAALRVQGPVLGFQLPIRAVVVGGAIAVLKFYTRTTTHDVDFALDANLIQLADGVTLSGEQGERTLDKFWFNPAMSFYLNAPA
ncbi:hypothetical protein TRAPUB_2790 [Trametes pubescens]|uniref:Uncharacterized protein n=1 Tax=Trametes pubescens TaxID=154538 RepID=A0A1M2VFJ5_TRAPU|nr:hypothetical protein TRAPUB_2790 [Trametes pubescens]